MKKTTAIIFVLLLCLSILTAANAEGSLKRGWEVVERKTFMFEQLSEIHFGPEAVVEYDAAHFAVFADPETGYWGVGLKAEYYPVNEDDTYTFENPAVIVLSDIGFDNNYRTNYDIRISIDRVTYASLPGSTVNADADVLGVFGYSRDMETVGFLSGWGCRAQRDENGTKVKDGEVWQVEDAVAYDTFGLCTEVELSVTAVGKNGREIDPKYVGRTKWIAADLDVLQSDVAAEGYEPHYFDEQLILKDGIVYSYSVQQGHVLNIDGKVRVNDSIMGYGVKTGLSEGELAKRYASVQLQQDKMTAQVNWRGCGSEEAPARTELVFIGAEKIAEKETTDYTVRYLEEGTEKQLADPKTVEDTPVGDTVTETAIEIADYDLVSESSQSIKIVRDASENVITFYYKKAISDYGVHYLDESTGELLAAPKYVRDQTVGSEVTETAIDIENYDLVSESMQSIKIVRNASENVITFYYKRALTDYMVRYIDKDSGEDIAEPVQWEGCYVGDVVESRARIISGYELDDETTKQIELKKDPKENIIIFVYVKIPKYTLTYHVVGDAPEGPIVPAKVTDILKGRDVTLAAPLTYTGSGELPMESYTVKYLEIGTDKEVAKTKVVPNVKVETQITERALNVQGYRLVSDETQPITIQQTKLTQWTFTGWCSTGGCTNVITEISNIQADTDVYGCWVPEEIEIARNELVFYYEREPEELWSYKVRYINIETNSPIAEDKVVTGIHPGQSIIENAIVIKNYTSLDTKFIWKADEDGIVKIFYYYYSGSIDDLG